MLGRLLPAVVVVALAGCGGDDGDRASEREGTRTTATTTTATTPTTTTAPTPAQQREQARLEALARKHEPVRACLDKAGFRVSVGASAVEVEAAPDFQLVAEPANSRERGAFIAFYESRARADRVVPRIRRNARRFKDVTIERRGQVVIFWIALRDQAERARVRSCAFETTS